MKTRQTFIELDYVNGVYDKCGNEVIRPLNESEKAFLNKFYEEEVNSNFQHDISVKAIYQHIKRLKEEGYTEEDSIIKTLHIKANKLKKQNNLNKTREEERVVYRRNNERNRCIYNRAQTNNNIEQLDEESYDKIHEDLYGNPDVAELDLIRQIEENNEDFEGDLLELVDPKKLLN